MIYLVLTLLSQSSGDTLRWYDTTATRYEQWGLSNGGYFHWAIVLPIDSSYDGRTVHSGRVHIWEAMDLSGTMRLCLGNHNHPVSILDSGSFFSTGYGFYEVFFGNSIVLHAGDTVWLWCTQWHAQGQEPATADGSFCIYYGSLASIDGMSWETICTYYLGSNWVMELILTPSDVEEGPAKPTEFFMSLISSNPVKGNLKLQYGIPLEDEGPASLKIYDVSGRCVQTVFSEEKPAGYYELAIPVSSLSAGTYFLRLEASNKARTEKVIKGGD